MKDCSLNLTPFADTPGVCDHCGNPLTGRRTRWCSDACSVVVFQAHDWNSARRAAKRRDNYRCVTCGATETVDKNLRSSLEVNHIEPRVGRGYGMGCWNHLDNLETLCHDCHVKVTKAQAAARRAAQAEWVATRGLATNAHPPTLWEDQDLAGNGPLNTKDTP